MTTDDTEADRLMERWKDLIQKVHDKRFDKDSMATHSHFEQLEATLRDLQALPKEITAKFNRNLYYRLAVRN